MSPGSHVVSEANRTTSSLDACPGSGLSTLPANSRVFCNEGSPVKAKLDKLK